jgi:hypothetical protein
MSGGPEIAKHSAFCKCAVCEARKDLPIARHAQRFQGPYGDRPGIEPPAAPEHSIDRTLEQFGEATAELLRTREEKIRQEPPAATETEARSTRGCDPETIMRFRKMLDRIGIHGYYSEMQKEFGIDDEPPAAVTPTQMEPAEVELSNAGPSLKVFGIPVTAWLGTMHNKHAIDLRDRINAEATASLAKARLEMIDRFGLMLADAEIECGMKHRAAFSLLSAMRNKELAK